MTQAWVYIQCLLSLYNNHFLLVTIGRMDAVSHGWASSQSNLRSTSQWGLGSCITWVLWTQSTLTVGNSPNVYLSPTGLFLSLPSFSVHWMEPDLLLTAWRFPSSVDTKSRLSGSESVAPHKPWEERPAQESNNKSKTTTEKSRSQTSCSTSEPQRLHEVRGLL